MTYINSIYPNIKFIYNNYYLFKNIIKNKNYIYIKVITKSTNIIHLLFDLFTLMDDGVVAPNHNIFSHNYIYIYIYIYILSNLSPKLLY